MSNEATTVAEQYMTGVDIMLGLTLIGMALFGLSGNGFVLYVLAKNIKRRINYLTNLVLFQLALTDLVGVAPTFFIGYCLLYGRDFPPPSFSVKILQNIIGWLGIAMPLASIYIVAILSFGRCIAIYRSFDYPVVMSERNTNIMCTVAWLLAIAVACLPYYGGYQYKYDPRVCFMHTSMRKTFPKFSDMQLHVVFIVINVVLVIIPALFMISCCAAVIIRLKIKASRASGENNKDEAVAHAANTVLMITIAFIICYGPYFLSTTINLLSRFDVIGKYWLIESIGEQSYAYMTIVVNFVCMALNSCINPCIYYLRAKKFRQDMAHTMRKKMHRLSTTFTRMNSSHRLSSRSGTLSVLPHSSPGDKRLTQYTRLNSNGSSRKLHRQLTVERAV